MQPGIVVRIRVNPTTCMSVLDVLESVGIKVEEKSFATCVSAALNILVETAKQSGVLPHPDPYEFNQRMMYHTGSGAPDRKSLPKNNVGQMNPLIFPEKTPDLGMPRHLREGKPKPVAYTPTAEDLAVAEQVKLQLGIGNDSIPAVTSDANSEDIELIIMKKEANKILTNLLAKKEQAEKGVAGILWGVPDEIEFERVYGILYPDE